MIELLYAIGYTPHATGSYEKEPAHSSSTVETVPHYYHNETYAMVSCLVTVTSGRFTGDYLDASLSFFDGGLGLLSYGNERDAYRNFRPLSLA